MKKFWRKAVERFLTAWEAARSFFERYYVRYCVQVDKKAKCPACGVRHNHKIRYHSIAECLMHECSECSANWFEKPIFAPEHWAVKPQEEEEVAEADTAGLPPTSIAKGLGKRMVN